MDKVVTRSTLKADDGQLRYWRSRTPAERIAAVEVLRQQFIAQESLDEPPEA